MTYLAHVYPVGVTALVRVNPMEGLGVRILRSTDSIQHEIIEALNPWVPALHNLAGWYMTQT